VALGHTLLVIIFQLLKKQMNYRELGADYFDRLDADRLARSLVRRLERLGHKVTLERQPERGRESVEEDQEVQTIPN
jgi:hypothetical protein